MRPAGLLVVSETPYAEGQGDRAHLSLSGADLATLGRLQERAERAVFVVNSGRPLIITKILPEVGAVMVGWLPGSEGLGMADGLFGDVPLTGKLPFSWPRSMDQLHFDFSALPGEGCAAPLLPFGYGLGAHGDSEVPMAACLESG